MTVLAPGPAARRPARLARAEALLRLLENTLALAERPDELVVYAAHAKAARDPEALRAIVRALGALREGETLVVQSGRPVAVLPTGPRAPLVVLANGNLVGRAATPESFYALEARGLTAWGGLTAGCWQYIGSQGVLQGVYETFAQVAREHFGGTLEGRLVVTAGLGGMGGAQPLAVSRMLGGTTLVAEADPATARRRLEEGRVDALATTVDEALALSFRARAVAVTVNAVELLEALVARGVTPDVATDLTAAHDLRHGYVPLGLSASEARALRAADPAELERRARAAVARHARALLALRERGAVAFDSGNNLRPQAVAAGVGEAGGLDVFSSRYLRPLFAQGIGPFRWICTSGEDADGTLVDDLAAAAAPRAAPWLALAREHVPREGLPARIAWLGHGERSRLALAVNAAVADGRLRGPVAFTRDHMDGAAMAHPQILTEGLPDGSDAIADWPLLVGLVAASAGADLVALHQGGGGYAGFSQSAGSTVVADGTPEAAERLRAVLDAETALGVLRHADAGVPEGRAAAHHHDLGGLDA